MCKRKPLKRCPSSTGAKARELNTINKRIRRLKKNVASEVEGSKERLDEELKAKEAIVTRYAEEEAAHQEFVRQNDEFAAKMVADINARNEQAADASQAEVNPEAAIPETIAAEKEEASSAPQLKEILKDDNVAQIASNIHEEWRQGRLREDGSFEPRLKDDGEGGQVDIANTEFDALPAKWQEENARAAYSAVESAKAVKAEHPNSSESEQVELTSDSIHQAWLSRNGEWADDSLKVPYAQLPEDEKEKDRTLAYQALGYQKSVKAAPAKKAKTPAKKAKVASVKTSPAKEKAASAKATPAPSAPANTESASVKAAPASKAVKSTSSDSKGYNSRGFSAKGVHKVTGNEFDEEGYDQHGYDYNGFDSKHIHPETGTKYNEEGYNYLGEDKRGDKNPDWYRANVKDTDDDDYDVDVDDFDGDGDSYGDDDDY